jgi:hypothetical protein
MEAALVVLVVAVLFGGMVLMLAMGYQDSEAERNRQSKARQADAAARAAAIVSVPGFFAGAERTITRPTGIFDEAMVNRLEHQIQLEQAVVAQFVHHPSIDNLYRRAGTSLHAS